MYELVETYTGMNNIRILQYTAKYLSYQPKFEMKKEKNNIFFVCPEFEKSNLQIMKGQIFFL